MLRISLRTVVFLFAVILFPLVAFANVNSAVATGAKMSSGEFIIYVLKDSNWQKAGSLSYDKLFAEKELPLDNYIDDSGKVEMRIQEVGGGAAHIDSVLLGGVHPINVRDIRDGVKKLSRKDFDVIDAFGKTIEMTFKGKDIVPIMRLTARIESAHISKIPFQFPSNNTGKMMDINSQFYSYKLNSERGSLKLDGMLSEVSNKKPFFKEYSWTGTGHPSGYTYGWVRNDKENLYVAIDFTPDDTMDGDKDYTKVYIKTDNGLKEYKVSVPELKWGRPGFSYTNKVAYQHKVYEFKIPLRDIYDNDVKKRDDLQIAFAAYGTAGPNEINLSLNAQPQNSEVFSYTSDILSPTNFNIINTGIGTFQGFYSVPAGTYVFTQSSTPPGWTLTAISCVNGSGTDNSVVNLPAGSVTIPFVAGDSYNCMFTNQRASSIPTVSQWGMIAFVVLAGLGAIYFMRKKSRAKS
jgi:hypothetical protein